MEIHTTTFHFLFFRLTSNNRNKNYITKVEISGLRSRRMMGLDQDPSPLSYTRIKIEIVSSYFITKGKQSYAY